MNLNYFSSSPAFLPVLPGCTGPGWAVLSLCLSFYLLSTHADALSY